MNKLFFIIKALSLIGSLLALYLLWQQFYQPEFQPCTINTTINCEAIITGAVAKTFGLPTPLYGLLGYAAIFMAALGKKKKLLLGIATVGLAFCLWIGYRELFELRVICPICIMCQLIILSVFSLAVAIYKKGSYINDKKLLS